MAAFKKLASKIFCLCCQKCEESDINDAKAPSQTQEIQLHTNRSLPWQKLEPNRKNLKRINAQSLISPEKKHSSSSSDISELTAHNPQTVYARRNLNRYYQERWSFQPCLIGRP